MTRSGSGGFYEALGIELPRWSGRNVSVRCFANPDAHAHGDRSPSCSVSLENGAWRCWTCGATGGGYDAADRLGRSPREAMDPLIYYGLAERRPVGAAHHRRATAPRRKLTAKTERSTPRPPFVATEADVARWQAELACKRWPLARLRVAQRALWHQTVAQDLGLGYDRSRITFPLRNGQGALQGVLRYAPVRTSAPKMIAVPGSALGLFPHPALEPSPWILLVEGPPDTIAARSVGLPAIGVPGDHAWEPHWAASLAGRQVTVLMDCDDAGRRAARRIAEDLRTAAITVETADLAPGRSDGYDLTDWLAAHRELPTTTISALLGRRLN